MQTEMDKLFAEGGIMQQGGTVDPVSGNDVPPGAMAEEVRDDIDAKLSEGEFVFPADVVRYVGLDTLMKIRDKAKAGLKRMNEIGQMGNAEEVPDAEALHGGKDEMDDESFSSEIDSIMSEGENQEYAAGGDVRKYAPGGYIGGTANKELYKDAPIRGFEMVEMVNKEGQTIYIPFINGRPQLSIPQGYTVKSSDVTTTPTTPVTGTGTPTPQPTDGGGAGGADGGAPAAPSSPGFTIGEDGFATPNETSPTIGSALGAIVGMVTGLPPALTSQIGKSAISQSNFANSQAAMSFNVAVADTTAPANLEGITTAAATTGPTGTGGSAASAAAAAAAAASAVGHSPESVAAASQAAADATIGGAGPAAAAAAAADAANAAAADAADAEGGGLGTGIGVGSSGTAAADGVGADGMGVGTGVGVGGDGDGGAGAGTGNAMAKGGFVSKKKKTTAPKSTSLVSRRN